MLKAPIKTNRPLLSLRYHVLFSTLQLRKQARGFDLNRADCGPQGGMDWAWRMEWIIPQSGQEWVAVRPPGGYGPASYTSKLTGGPGGSLGDSLLGPIACEEVCGQRGKGGGCSQALRRRETWAVGLQTQRPRGQCGLGCFRRAWVSGT